MMATETGYNGWVNYETWNVALWIDNEEGSYNYWREAAQECWNEADAPSANARLTGREPFTREEKARFALADRLKHEMQEAMPDLGASMWADLLNAALDEVNWHDVADHYLADVDKTAESEEDDDE